MLEHGARQKSLSGRPASGHWSPLLPPDAGPRPPAGSRTARPLPAELSGPRRRPEPCAFLELRASASQGRLSSRVPFLCHPPGGRSAGGLVLPSDAPFPLYRDPGTPSARRDPNPRGEWRRSRESRGFTGHSASRHAENAGLWRRGTKGMGQREGGLGGRSAAFSRSPPALLACSEQLGRAPLPSRPCRPRAGAGAGRGCWPRKLLQPCLRGESLRTSSSRCGPSGI